ncbi:hypothetical protein [Pseudoalteromonas sp. APC 3250]|uniref:hypothetical protein n=1 Tax=Pseudoalteromonas sp. APC 3250 TaxID=3035184 RepID=UPI0025B4EF20|nr:hypothetical protein [Pseudoalteromonas sp. APC 3250]MDN3413173.1 hypothetical protein [Pseudoalteromonas sp. APC 3250]
MKDIDELLNYNIRLVGHDRLDEDSISLSLVDTVIEHSNKIYTYSIGGNEVKEFSIDQFISRYGYDYREIDCVFWSLGTYKYLKKENSFKHPKIHNVIKTKAENKKKVKSFCGVESSSHLDFFAITLNVKKRHVKKLIRELLNEDLIERCSKKKQKCRYYNRKAFNESEHFYIDYSPKGKARNYLKVRWNPAFTSEKYLRYFFSRLKSLVGKNYSEIVNESLISRVDFALDFKGDSVKDTILNISGSSKLNNYFNSESVMETKIVGASEFRLQVYNKSLQQGSNCPDSLNRIEVQLKRPKIDELRVQLKNVCSIFEKSNKVRMYSNTDNKYFSHDEMNDLKYLGVVGLRSSLNNSNEKKRLSRNLAKIEVTGFGDSLMGGSLAELQKLKRLLLKP